VKVRAEKIRSAAERIEAIVNRVQFASALGDGTIPIGRQAVDINAMLRRLIDQVREERRGKPIELDLHAESQVVKGDETLLSQAFENVVMNSVKYSSADSPILISTTRQGPVVHVAIEDRGRGIAASDLTRVREPYYRGAGSKGISGAGLGLFFAERIIEAHDGTIGIESEAGKGTRVTIEIPHGTEPVLR
jgi:signal transduction histidine kinase